MSATSVFTRSARLAFAAWAARMAITVFAFAHGTTSAQRSPSFASWTSITRKL